MFLNVITLSPEAFIFATGLIALILLYYRPVPALRDPVSALIVSAIIVFIVDDLSIQDINLSSILGSLFLVVLGTILADVYLNLRNKLDKAYESSIRNEERINALYQLFDGEEIKNKMNKNKK